MTIPKECKRLAEVDFPILPVGKNAVAEKDSRSGHVPKLHIWPAARPTASGRAMLLALLLPDPCDPRCPTDFKTKAKDALSGIQGVKGDDDDSLRKALLQFIAQFSAQDESTNPTLLNAARRLVIAAHERVPVVVDPFAGGGSIPLEALRLGCESIASDLNPLASLIQRTVLYDIPTAGGRLIGDYKSKVSEVAAEANRELRPLYPVADGWEPLAYLWAPTVRCEAPNCGIEIPILKSWWLSNKGEKLRALRFSLSKGKAAELKFDIFTPVSKDQVPKATIAGSKVNCPACSSVMPKERVRQQLTAKRGGASSAKLLVVVEGRKDRDGRRYRLPSQGDLDAVRLAERKWAELVARNPGVELSEPWPRPPGLDKGDSAYYNFATAHLCGCQTWGDIFTPRQKLALATYARIIRKHFDKGSSDNLLALTFSKMVDMNSALCHWQAHAQIPAHTLVRYAFPAICDFAECVPISNSSGSLGSASKRSLEYLETGTFEATPAEVHLWDAAEQLVPDETADVWFTDPPYYDAIPYSHVSDFFLVWLKRLFNSDELKDPWDSGNPLSPKHAEIVEKQSRLCAAPKDVAARNAIEAKDKMFFETRIAEAFSAGRRSLASGGIGCIVFAHKTTEGWEALLSAIVRAGWVVTASWPITTEMGSRTRARESATLSSTIHLVVRPRSTDASTGDWGDLARELPQRTKEWMSRLEAEGIKGADLVFACIGPAMELYSRFTAVLDAEDREIPLGGDPEATEPHKRGYLAYVWEVVGRLALERVLGQAGARGSGLEEDARLTALFLWTLQSSSANGNGGEAAGDDETEADAGDDDEEPESGEKKKAGWTLPFDVARRFAQPLGIHLDAWEDRILETDKGIVRLLPVAERKEQLFGSEGIEDAAEELGAGRRKGIQLTLTEEGAASPRGKGKGRKKAGASGEEAVEAARRAATTLDRVHAAMLLQSAGQTAALRTLLTEEKRRGPDFERLSNALAALYPRGSEERRLVEAMLLAMPR